MMKERKRKRCFYELNDRRAVVPPLTLESLAVVCARYTCPNHMLWDSTNPGRPAWPVGHLSPQWNRNPEPIDIAVQWIAETYIDCPDGINVSMIDRDVFDAIQPYCRDIYVGRVASHGKLGDLQPTLSKKVQSDRGRHCLHLHHECCGVFTNQIGWAKGAIVERTLDDRLVYLNQDGNILVADELAERLELKGRFPKLGLQRVDVVSEPLDGETIPGDPGWDGVLRRKYSASLGVLVNIPHSSIRGPWEQKVYGEFAWRLNRELAAISAEKAFRERGGHGSCRFYARGMNTASLKAAALRALSGWRVAAHFSISLHDLDRGYEMVEEFCIPGDGDEPRAS
jgi:hypothetical protein